MRRMRDQISPKITRTRMLSHSRASGWKIRYDQTVSFTS
jgi:hypothetical protein